MPEYALHHPDMVCLALGLLFLVTSEALNYFKESREKPVEPPESIDEAPKEEQSAKPPMSKARVLLNIVGLVLLFIFASYVANLFSSTQSGNDYQQFGAWVILFMIAIGFAVSMALILPLYALTSKKTSQPKSKLSGLAALGLIFLMLGAIFSYQLGTMLIYFDIGLAALLMGSALYRHNKSKATTPAP